MKISTSRELATQCAVAVSCGVWEIHTFLSYGCSEYHFEKFFEAETFVGLRIVMYI